MAKIPGGSSLLDPEQVLENLEITDGMRVADLGCGRLGYFVLPLANLVGPKGTVFAVDIIKEILKSVETRAKLSGILNVKTVWSDIEKVGATAIASESLDIVLISNLLFQVKEHENVIKEASRLLKSGGQLLVIDWKGIHTPFGPIKEMRIKKDDVKKWAKNNNLSLINDFEAGEYHWGLIFKKK